MAAGRGRALCCRGAGLRSRPERREKGSARAREGRRGRGGVLEAEGRRDGEGPGGRRPQELSGGEVRGRRKSGGGRGGARLGRPHSRCKNEHLSSQQHLVLARPFETFP